MLGEEGVVKQRILFSGEVKRRLFYHYRMSVDPLIHANDDRSMLQRLLRENRELREANALLRVSAEAKSTGSNGKTENTSAVDKVKGNNSPLEEGGGKLSFGAAAVKKLKEEVQRTKEELEKAQCEQKKSRNEYKQLKSVFESFVVEVCEREEAYKLIFLKVHEEIEEQKKRCESLQRQLQERPPVVATPVLVTPAPAPAPTPVTVGMDPSSLYDLVDSFRSSLSELEQRLGYKGDAGSRHPARDVTSRATKETRPAVAVSRLQKKDLCTPGLKPSDDDDHHYHYHGDDHQRQCNSQMVEGSTRLVVPAQGAGALRTAGLSDTRSTTTERKKRGRKKAEEVETLKRHAVDLSFSTASVSLFKTFTPTTEKPKVPVVNFGSEPIADYLALLEKTDPKSVDVLRRELMKFCASDVNILASYAVDYFLSKSALEAPVLTLWKHTERVMQIFKDVFHAFVKHAVRKLVRLLGPESATTIDHSPQVRSLALVVRMACVARLKDNAQSYDALFVAFYECTVSALRTWHVVSSAGEQRHVLRPWMVAVRHLCGFVEDFHMVMRYYSNSERVLEALKLPNSLSRYAVQAVMTSCYFTSSPQSMPAMTGRDTNTDMETWMTFCDAMDWSYSALPSDLMGFAAAKILARSEDVFKRGEALLSLRLLVLHKGLGFLQALTEELRTSGGEVDIDAAFAELFSLAVIDLRLEDPRDEQWGRAMAFFVDYLSASSVEQAKSAEEFLAACKDTHLLVLRAVLQLCHGVGTITGEGVEQIAGALRWVRALHVCLTRATRENKSSAMTHPFEGSQLGRELRYLCLHEL